VKALKEAFLRGEQVDLESMRDPHTVAGVLKSFFRDSQDPLLTFELYECWLLATGNSTLLARNLPPWCFLLRLFLPQNTKRTFLSRFEGLLTYFQR